MYKYKFSKVKKISRTQKVKITQFYFRILNFRYFRGFIKVYLSDFGFLTPYLERPLVRSFTPTLSNAPRIIW